MDQSRAPIMEALENFKDMRIVPFDVPGHKRGRGSPELTAFLGQQCMTVDVNSMKPLDNLCHPTSVIREAEELAAGKQAQSTDDLDAVEEELEAMEGGVAAPEKRYGFLAVCAGEGLAAVFRDLGIDSLDFVDIVMSLEDEFDTEFPEEDMAGIKTVGDIVKYIEDKIQ